MTRKNIFNFFIIFIISFLSFFYNFDIKINRNDNSKYIKFIIFNKVYADINNYNYITDGSSIIVRTNKEDSGLKGNFSDGATSFLNGLDWVPGIGSMIKSFVYIGQGLNLNKNDIAKAFTGDISSILTGAGMIVSVIGVSDKDANSVMALDQTYSSNLYCRYQNIYEEETDLIHRSGPASRGGLEHPIFPIYPLDIKVNDETGLCDFEYKVKNKEDKIETHNIIDENFKNVGGLIEPSNTKCSYSYTAASEQCVKDLTQPILIAYDIQKAIADVVCTIADLKSGKAAKEKAAKEAAEMAAKKSDEAIDAAQAIGEATGEAVEKVKKTAKEAREAAEKAIKKSEKAARAAEKASINLTKNMIFRLAGVISRGALRFFADNRFIYDPVNFMAILGVEFTFSFLMTALFGIPTDPVSAVAYAVCLGTTIGAYAAFTTTSRGVVLGMANSHHEKAKSAIKNYTFCGYDWFTYSKTTDGKYYTKGVNSNSYYKKIYDCINGISAKEGGECGKISNDNICTDGEGFCKTGSNQQISKLNKDIKNRIFREYVYGGKEYDSGPIEKNVLNSGKEFDNRAYLFKDGGYDHHFCIDPRTPQQKGFKSIYQKYYMRGNDKANFACSRFYYDGKSSCILYKDQIYDEDKKNMISYENGEYYLLPEGSASRELRNKYSKQCQEAFIEARKCCQYRSRHLICLENKSNNHNTFCFSNVVEEYADENTKMTSNIADLFSNVQNDGDFFKYTCELDGVKFEATKKIGTNHVCVFSYGMCPFDFKLNAGLNYKATYCDANTIDPDLDLENTIERGSTHLNADDCRKGLFSADMREEYKSLSEKSSKFASYIFNEVSKDMGCNSSECSYNKNDFKTIYNYEKISDIISSKKEIKDLTVSELRLLSEINCDPTDMTDCNEKFNNIFEKGFTAITDKGIPNIAVTKYNISQYLVNNLKSSAYGQIKNFCQYRAHCVEVEDERLMEEREDSSTLFMDSSCTGYTNNSRNLLQGTTLGLPRQLSAPIVECIHESLKNLINGVAGNSLCLDGHAINNDGFCDSDTAEDIETALKNKDTEFFEKKYDKRYDDIDEKDVYIVKGQLLPTNYNPFLKLQRNFINIIRVALTLFLVIYFYKMFLLGKIGDFTRPENVGKLVFNVFKFSLVTWLIFYNGWQQGVYTRLVNFSTGTFNFVNNLLIKAINNPNNQMLSLKGGEPKQLDIERYDKISDEEDEDFHAICYRYDIFDNINYKTINELTGYCDTGYTRVTKNQIYIAPKENKRYQSKGKLIISTNQEMAKLISFIDEYNDNNSSRLVIYKIDENNQTISIAGSFKNEEKDSIKEELYNGDGIHYNSSQVTTYDTRNVWSKYYDGCYFDTTEYKKDKSYLALFDTLDCKFIRYLGFSTDRMVPNLIIFSAMMIVPNYLFEGIKEKTQNLKDGTKKTTSLIQRVITTVGSVLFGFVMSFVFIMFNVVIKVLYIFLSSFFTLSILIFVSPIVLPLMFYERTKKMVNTWFELIIDTVIKPTFNLCIMIFYINILDIILLKNVMFIKHDWRGRGASIKCFAGSASSFVCLTNNLIGGLSPNDIKGLFADGLMSFLLDMLMIVMLFTLSDSMLETFDNIVKQIFNFMSNGSGASVMGLSGGHSVAGSEGNSTEEVILGKKTGETDENGKEIREGGAMGAGKSLETFRSDYLVKAPGAALDSFINKTANIGKAISFNDIKSGDLKKNANDKAGTKFVKALGRGAGYMGAAVSNVGAGLGNVGAVLSKARDAFREGDAALRAAASRIVKVHTKRAVDEVKNVFTTTGENINIAFKNIKSEKRVEKLKENIEEERRQLNETEEKLEEFSKGNHIFKKSYYEKKKQKLEDEMKELEEELAERKSNNNKLKYKTSIIKNRINAREAEKERRKNKNNFVEEEDIPTEEESNDNNNDTKTENKTTRDNNQSK